MQATTGGPSAGRSTPDALSRYDGTTNRPVFVGACPRSGTTLLRTMLNAHPGLAVPLESRFMLEVWEQRAMFGNLAEPEKRVAFARWLTSRTGIGLDRITTDRAELAARIETAGPSLGSLLGACFEYYAEKQGKSRWGDKRPMYAQHMRTVFALFPDAQFVHIVRDPRASIASMRKLGWFNGDIVHATDLWKRAIRQVEASRARLAPDQFIEIGYESLVTDAPTVLKQLTDFAGLDQAGLESMLAYHESADLPRSERYHPLVASPLTSAAVRSWQETFDPGELAFVEKALEPEMLRHGYEPVAGQSQAREDLQQALRRRERHRARRRMRENLVNTKLKLTYRYPVAAVRVDGDAPAPDRTA